MSEMPSLCSLIIPEVVCRVCLGGVLDVGIWYHGQGNFRFVAGAGGPTVHGAHGCGFCVIGITLGFRVYFCLLLMLSNV